MGSGLRVKYSTPKTKVYKAGRLTHQYNLSYWITDSLSTLFLQTFGRNSKYRCVSECDMAVAEGF